MIAPRAVWWLDAEVEAQANAFAERYAARSGVSVEFLHEWGRYPEPCACGEPGCEGFIMGFQWEDALTAQLLRQIGLAE